MARAQTLSIPVNQSKVKTELPYFLWEDNNDEYKKVWLVKKGPYAGKFHIQISQASEFKTLTVDDKVPGFIHWYSPGNSLQTGATYYWRVRLISHHGEIQTWSKVSSFTIAEKKYFDVPASANWEQVRSILSEAVNYGNKKENRKYACLRFPKNGRLNLVQEPGDNSDYLFNINGCPYRKFRPC